MVWSGSGSGSGSRAPEYAPAGTRHHGWSRRPATPAPSLRVEDRSLRGIGGMHDLDDVFGAVIGQRDDQALLLDAIDPQPDSHGAGRLLAHMDPVDAVAVAVAQ